MVVTMSMWPQTDSSRQGALRQPLMAGDEQRSSSSSHFGQASQHTPILNQLYTVVFGPGPLGCKLTPAEDGRGGTMVAIVEHGTQASQQGVRPGSIIVTLNEIDVRHVDAQTLGAMIASTERPLLMTFRLSEPPKQTLCVAFGRPGPCGLKLATGATGGTIVGRVDEGGQAAELGVRSGLSVLEINGVPMAGKDANEVGAFIAANPGRPLTILFSTATRLSVAGSPSVPSAAGRNRQQRELLFGPGPLGLRLADGPEGAFVGGVEPFGAGADQQVPVGSLVVAINGGSVEGRSATTVGSVISAAARPLRMVLATPEARASSSDDAALLSQLATGAPPTPPPPPTPPAEPPTLAKDGVVAVLQAKQVAPIDLRSEITLGPPLGSGAFGVVLRCTFAGTACAIKQLPNAEAKSMGMLQGMLQEFDVMMKLRHPNVVLTMGVAVDPVDQTTGIVMELMQASLMDVLTEPSFAPFRSWHAAWLCIASDVAKGMTCIHSHGLLHRDLKPGNILLDASWIAKVADLGNVVQTSGAPGEEAFAGEVTGTPPYMAPEIMATRQYARPVDVWAFGAVLAHMGTGKAPYHNRLGEIRTRQDMLEMIAEGRASPVELLMQAEDTPPPIVELAVECCDRTPAQRPSFGDISNRIDQQAGGEMDDLRPLVRIKNKKVGTGAASAAPVPMPSSPDVVLDQTYSAAPDAHLSSTFSSAVSSTFVAPWNSTFVSQSSMSEMGAPVSPGASTAVSTAALATEQDPTINATFADGTFEGAGGEPEVERRPDRDSITNV